MKMVLAFKGKMDKNTKGKRNWEFSYIKIRNNEMGVKWNTFTCIH